MATRSREPTPFCFQGRDDGAHETGDMGSAAAAGRVDSREHTAFGGHIGAGFDANAIFLAGTVQRAAEEMFCDERFAAAEGVDSARVLICQVE
jgi:hypothetical protein